MIRNKQHRKYITILSISILILLLVAIISLFIGKYAISIEEVVSYILHGNQGSDEIKRHIIFDIRVPRILMSIIVGCGLALCGATLQGVLQNPLASPDVLGTSSAAGFGAALGILLFANNLILISVLSFVLGFISIVFIYLFCKKKKDDSILTVILSGMIIASVFTALISLIKFVADTDDTLPAITFWLMGSFASITMSQVKIVALPFIIGCIILYKYRWKLNVLSLGDDEAIVLKVNPKKTRIILFIVVALLISLSVSVSGIIGWVGLVIPHITRRVIGSNNGYLLPLSGVFGSIFMIVVDNLARNMSNVEVPIGILTALIGAPLFAFIFLLRKEH